jgi:hypothetical protein
MEKHAIINSYWSIKQRVFTPIRMLMQYGADIHHPDNDGNSIFHTFSESTIDSMIKCGSFLTNDCHANTISTQNNDGLTPWDIAKK